MQRGRQNIQNKEKAKHHCSNKTDVMQKQISYSQSSSSLSFPCNQWEQNKTGRFDPAAARLIKPSPSPNISPSAASNFTTKSQEKAAIKSIGGSSKLGVGDTAAPLRFPLQLAKHKGLRSRGLEEARYGPGTPGDRGEWEHGQRIDTHGPGFTMGERGARWFDKSCEFGHLSKPSVI